MRELFQKNLWDETYDILRIWSQFDGRSFWVFSLENLGNNMRIRNSSHTRKAVVLRLACIMVPAEFFDFGFGTLQFGTRRLRQGT